MGKQRKIRDILAAVSFGDKPADMYLEIVINQAADKFALIDLAAANKIKNDR